MHIKKTSIKDMYWNNVDYKAFAIIIIGVSSNIAFMSGPSLLIVYITDHDMLFLVHNRYWQKLLLKVRSGIENLNFGIKIQHSICSLKLEN